ncbi:hypothetical protein EC968_008580 [Mortierella alpina]|nr:hypothetical protein EC968_008580 [Mortierella alpina]
MSQSMRSDQFQSSPPPQGQGQAPELSMDPAVQQVVAERNGLRSQNDQLWKIIEKQRIIIQNLQKDVAKVTAERDQLRQSAAAVSPPVSAPKSSSSSSLACEQDHLSQSSLESAPSHPNGQSPYNYPQSHQPPHQQYQPQPYQPQPYQPQPYQPQHHPHQQPPGSKRSGDRRAQDGDANLESPLPANGERDPELVSGFNPNSSFSSTASSSTEHRQQYQTQPRPQHQDHSSRKNGHGYRAAPPNPLPLTPSSTYDGDYGGGKTELGLEEPSVSTNGLDCNGVNHPTTTQTEEGLAHELSDPELQHAATATTANATPVQNYNGSQQMLNPGGQHEQDPRTRYDPNHTSDGNMPDLSELGLFDLIGARSTIASPGLARNVSGNIAIAPHLMPHLPPRSPRRERKDDQNASPNASDNEEEISRSQQGSRRKGPSGQLLTPTRARGDNSLDQPSPISPLGQFSEQDLQGSHAPNGSRGPVRQPNGYEASPPELDPSQQSASAKAYQQGPPPGPRRNVSGQIPIIPTNLSTLPQELGPSSPLNGANVGSLPGSPIAAIIDQDAEKFRVYMNKLNSPSRKLVSGPISAVVPDGQQDHAAALGQAVAMENIQAQIELKSQLMGQVQTQGARGLTHVQPEEQRNGRSYNGPSQGPPDQRGYPGTNIPTNPDLVFSQDDSRVGLNGHQLPLPMESRERRRQSSLPVMEGYPKIAARSTSHQREEDDPSREYAVPQPPKRYDSQPNLDQSNGTMRSSSPTPSGNSSVTNTLANSLSSTGQAKSGPTVHQQAFHMFGENLECVSVLVVGSTIKTNDRGKELLLFLISIGQELHMQDGVYSHKEDDELWRIEKQYSDFVNLDSKVDARKVALEQYLQQLTSLRIKDTRDLCEFLSTSVIERGARKDGLQVGWKEGYLTKRGKNFGGWKTRFFLLRGPVLEYFDTKDGHHLGSIALSYAQIGRQQSQDRPQEGGENSADPNSYRHAFLILEPKKGQTVADAKRNPNSVIRHVLCAETDQERDEWVEALLLHVGKEPLDAPEPSERERAGKRMPEIQKVAATPIKDLASVKGNEKLLLNQEAYERQQRSVPPSPSAQHFQQHPMRNGGGMPQSPTMANMGMGIDDRLSAERQSAEGQYANQGRNNYNQYGDQEGQPGSRAYPSHQQHHGQQQQQQQYQGQQQQYYQQQQQQQQQQQSPQHQQPPMQLPRNHSTHSLNQNQDDGNFKAPPENQTPTPQLSPAEVAEKKQKSRMTFHWPKKASKEDAPPQASSNNPSPGSKEAAGAAAPPPASQDSSRLRNFLGKGGSSNNGSNNSGNSSTTHAPTQASGQGGNLAPVRQVFGVTLEQAIDQARVQPGYELPAVVYRCIEYLNAHKAQLEEGIYRLNGSSAVIKSLKDRFNHDGDVALLASEDYYDIHAVAGLLKLFLRDLPASVLTRELHRDFLQVIELPNRNDRVNELTRLVACLPEANYTLLRALTAHLIDIVENADVNKMTARNVGIVFSPTLGIPAGVFALLMSDFDKIFHTHDGRIMPLENSNHLRGPGLADTSVSSESMIAV